MTFLPVLAGLAALGGYCLFCVRRLRLAAGLAPLASLSVLLLLLLAAGMAGILRPVTLVLWGLGWVLLAAEAFSACKQSCAAVRDAKASAQPLAAARAKSALSGVARRLAQTAPGAVLFWAGAAVLLLRLAFLQPEFTAFDEYSFWGMAAKLTSLHGQLYTVCESDVPWQMTQMAALPLASWFFQPFGGFAAWRAIFAGDVLLLAGLAAVLAPAEKAGRRVAFPLGVVLAVLLPAFSASGHTALLCPAWLEFLGDVPAGVLFGAAVAFWLAVREQPGPTRWLLLPVLCLAANIKSNTFVLALAAAGCIAVDAVCFAPRTEKREPALLRRIGFGLACFAAPAAQYLLWSRYTSGLVRANAASGGLGDTANVTLPAVAYNGIKILLGGIGENYFEWHRQDLYDYRAAMRTAFFEKSVSVFGAGAAVCAGIALIFLLAIVLAPTLHEKLRTGALAVCSTLCFGGYWLMILLSYAFLMKDSTAQTMPSYARYFNSYYIGWALLALAVLGRQAAAARPARRGFARTGALALAACVAGATLLSFEPQNTILGASRGQYAETRREYAVAQQASQSIEPGAKLFLVYQGDQGQKWFTYAYAMLPRILVYGAGGGTYGEPIYQNKTPYFQPYKTREFQRLVAESGADYILIVQSDNDFSRSYARLFTDCLAAAEQDAPVIYQITKDGYVPFCTLEQEAGQ